MKYFDYFGIKPYEIIRYVFIFLGHCELLVLLKEDFKMNLQATVQRLWDRAERAMSQFTYFNHLSVVNNLTSLFS